MLMLVLMCHEILLMDVQNFMINIVGLILVVVMVLWMSEKHVKRVHKMYEYVVETEFKTNERIVEHVRKT